MMSRFASLLIRVSLLPAVMAAQRGGESASHPGITRPADGMQPGRLWHEHNSQRAWNPSVLAVPYSGLFGTPERDPSPAQSSGGGAILMMPPLPEPSPEPATPPTPMQSEMRENSWPRS